MIDWETAKAGDRFDTINGPVRIVRRRIRRKADARALAEQPGRKVWIDGPRTWAVVEYEQFAMP